MANEIFVLSLFVNFTLLNKYISNSLPYQIFTFINHFFVTVCLNQIYNFLTVFNFENLEIYLTICKYEAVLKCDINVAYYFSKHPIENQICLCDFKAIKFPKKYK